MVRQGACRDEIENVTLWSSEEGDAIRILCIFSVCRLVRPVGSSVVSSLHSSFGFISTAQ